MLSQHAVIAHRDAPWTVAVSIESVCRFTTLSAGPRACATQTLPPCVAIACGLTAEDSFVP